MGCERRVLVLIGIVAGACMITAAGLFLVVLLPYSAATAAIADLAGADAAGKLTATLYAQTARNVRVGAALVLFVGFVVALRAGLIANYLGRLAVEFRQLAVELKSAASRVGAEDPWHLAALGAIFLAGAAIRIRYLFEPMRYDEAYTFLTYASRPFFVGMLYYTPNNHILNTVLMRTSYLLFGDAPWALRVPVLVAGILIVPLVYCAVRPNRNAALLAAALASVSFPLIEYSVNARGYALGAAFLLGMIIFARLLERAPGAWAPAGVCAALAVYSVPPAGFGVAGVFLWMSLSQRFRGVLRTAFAATAVGAVLLLPAFSAAGLSRTQANPWAVRLPVLELAAVMPRSIRFLWDYWTMREPVVLAWAILAGVAVTFALWITKRDRRPPIFFCIVLGCLALLFVTRFDPPRRIWLFLLPVYIGAAAEGLEYVSRWLRHTRTVFPLAAVAICAWTGVQILRGGLLYRPGGQEYWGHNGESYGFPNAEQLAAEHRSLFESGGQLLSDQPHDVPIRYALSHLRIRYRPSPDGDLLIVTKPGAPPADIVKKDPEVNGAGLEIVRKLPSYQYADVYLGKRRMTKPQGM